MKEVLISSDIKNNEIIISRINEKIDILSKTRTGILNEKPGWVPIFAVMLALLLNVCGFATQTTYYLVVWISASLYFYLFYPMLPMFLFPFRYVSKKPEESKEEKIIGSPIKWVKKIKIFQNKRIGVRLFMRFFILSLLPLTIGMIGIYLVSIIFSLILGNMGFIPVETSNLILIQCAGIILFYIEIFFFRHQLFNFSEYIRKKSSAKKKEIILLGISGFIFLIVGTVVVFLLLIAILLPGFTLTHFINVSEFFKVRSNIWILLILISQVIIMQYLQSFLSMKITRNMCDDLIERLIKAKTFIESGSHEMVKEKRYDHLQSKSHQIRESLRVLKETELYAFNRRQMFGLFPTYSVGINIPALFRITTLRDLQDVFFTDD